MLAADNIGFAASRLCKRDENVHFALNIFRHIRHDDMENKSVNRPDHGLALLAHLELCAVTCCLLSIVNFSHFQHLFQNRKSD